MGHIYLDILIMYAALQASQGYSIGKVDFSEDVAVEEMSCGSVRGLVCALFNLRPKECSFSLKLQSSSGDVDNDGHVKVLGEWLSTLKPMVRIEAASVEPDPIDAFDEGESVAKLFSLWKKDEKG